MPKRRYTEIPETTTGIRFLFAQEEGNPGRLHIEARHQVSPEEAISTYLNGATTWNALNLRYETATSTHVVYWARHASGAVLVISCFRRGDQT